MHEHPMVLYATLDIIVGFSFQVELPIAGYFPRIRSHPGVHWQIRITWFWILLTLIE